MGARDDLFWAEFLGVDPAAWASRGVSVRAHVGLVGYDGLWCFRRRDRVVVSVPAGWTARLSAKLDRCEPDALFDAMAGYRPWSDHAGDPCVLTHPEFRRRGYGTAVVSAVVAAALEEGKLLLYQTLEANRGAVQMAESVGYEQYARHVAVRLKRESQSNPPLPPT